MILDLTSPNSHLAESAGLFCQLQYGPQPLLNWVQLYHYTVSHGHEGAAIEDMLRDLCGPASDAAGIVSFPSGPRASGSLTWDLLRQVWAARLLAPANPRDRHAIANLAGLQMLLSAMLPGFTQASASRSPCLSALITLIHSIGFTSINQPDTTFPWFNLGQWRIKENQNDTPIVVLLDDLVELGWSDFLRLAFGLGDNENMFFAFAAPDARTFGPQANSSLIDLLKDERGRLRVKEGIDICPAAKNAILFLDLRLFNSRAVQEEMDFFKKLILLARQAADNAAIPNSLPWRGFTSHEIQAIESCIAYERVESDEYLIALTMLPRLIALVDPMLPIIIFSSTGQRRITEALKGYDSIITDFAKPRFWGGISGDVVDKSRAQLESAVIKALQLLKGRAFCRRLLTTTPSNRRSKLTEPYVEIFFDESRDVSETTFRVGGLVLVHESESKANFFNRSMLSRPLVWGPTDIDPNPRRDFIPKEGMPLEEYQNSIFGPVDQLLRNAGSQGAIGFCLKSPQNIVWHDSGDLTSPWCLDNFYRILVLQALEVLLFEAIPESLGQSVPRFKCGIYMATRWRAQSDADAPIEWAKLPSRYGVYLTKIKDKKTKLRVEAFASIMADSVYPIVAQVLALNPSANFNVIAARAGKLSYGTRRRDLYDVELPRPAHFLADLVVRYATNPGALSKQPSLRKWLDRGFIIEANNRFGFLNEACRYARAGRHVEAVLGAYKADLGHGGNASIDRWAKGRITQSVNAFSGSDFVEVCRRLSL